MHSMVFNFNINNGKVFQKLSSANQVNNTSKINFYQVDINESPMLKATRKNILIYYRKFIPLVEFCMAPH